MEKQGPVPMEDVAARPRPPVGESLIARERLLPQSETNKENEADSRGNDSPAMHDTVPSSC